MENYNHRSPRNATLYKTRTPSGLYTIVTQLNLNFLIEFIYGNDIRNVFRTIKISLWTT